MPLHLEENLDSAEIIAADAAGEMPASVEWRFDEPQPDWKPFSQSKPSPAPVRLSITDDALRVTLAAPPEEEGGSHGGIYVDLPDWQREDWAYVLVRARTSEKIDELGIRFNLREADDAGEYEDYEEYMGPFRYFGDTVSVIHDGSVQTYLLRADWTGGRWQGPWRQLGLRFSGHEAASIDLLSVQVIPKEAGYADSSFGVREVMRNRVYRRTMYVRAPAKLAYRVLVPNAGRLDFALGVLRDDDPVTFRVVASTAEGDPETLFEEVSQDRNNWAQRSVDLSELAGRTVTLSLEAEANTNGTIALWAAPTMTGSANYTKPNVIFYVIDGGAADYMSVYGYNRDTTPNIKRLAAEGALFEQAYSNSSWTKPSTASFMTSLHHSVLGGFRNWSDPVPEKAVTMAQHFHAADYQTGVFLANPNAGTLSGLQRGVDFMREGWEDFSYFGPEPHRESSRYLHEGFWDWRNAHPGYPFWAHFQTTDVHEDFPAAPPFSGLYVDSDQLGTWKEWDQRLKKFGDHGIYSEAYEKTGIDRVAFFSVHQGLYDETMAHNDFQIGRLVDRLKANGEWDNTLLVIGSDHSTRAAMDDMGLAVQDTLPPKWVDTILRPSISRIPLIFVWPGHIDEGQRFRQPVSMIDVLPTVLDLVGLPQPDVTQGRSLAPLLLGTGTVEPQPVIFDEYWFDHENDAMQGMIEVVDGRWGASLWLGPPKKDEDERRPMPLLLFDLWRDPLCLAPVNAEHPDLVERYEAFLEQQWRSHQALAQRFSAGDEAALTPEQLATLRALGYIE
jgi:arylsulfatase A-like enzyme